MTLRLLLIIQIIASLITAIPAFAEIKTVTHTLKQPFGGSQSPDDARTAGIARAKREALEQFGTYIESTTVVKNAQVDSDEILALTAGVTKAEVVKQKNYTDGDAFGMEITVTVELDTAVLEKSLKRLLEDRIHLKDLKDAREREKKLLARVAELEKENQLIVKSELKSSTLREEFQAASKSLTAIDSFNKAQALWDGKKFSNPKKAIEYLTEAINLEPNDADSYTLRGVAYLKLNLRDSAISDFNHVIRLDPNNAKAYFVRGGMYSLLGEFDRAIADFDQAIRLNPNYVAAYRVRGDTYNALKQFNRAISDYNRVIVNNANDTLAYNGRGAAYFELKQLIRALADFDHVISLDPKDALAYRNRGSVYIDQKQYVRSIVDFDQAIQLDPENARSYVLRGSAYILLNNVQKGCLDLKTACKFGECDPFELAQLAKWCE